jgi:hypothetical protein
MVVVVTAPAALDGSTRATNAVVANSARQIGVDGPGNRLREHK